ncbi:hypothetical protein OH76DRAFT_724308 [Lentinus brumalis]|uniref:Uncharacterized protein n=1 Tax=Lentinus brumalis TaxID=2498619 RepID=A0A371D553_9APHY|nr:hypothetical protein OH76DRAFT_724308 [Polyporus brumalis]
MRNHTHGVQAQAHHPSSTSTHVRSSDFCCSAGAIRSISVILKADQLQPSAARYPVSLDHRPSYTYLWPVSSLPRSPTSGNSGSGVPPEGVVLCIRKSEARSRNIRSGSLGSRRSKLEARSLTPREGVLSAREEQRSRVVRSYVRFPDNLSVNLPSRWRQPCCSTRITPTAVAT